MHISARQEQYGDAYLHTLTSVAGFSMAKPVPDDDSVDWVIGAKGLFATLHSPKIEVQVKCPFRFTETPDTISYAIPRKNYDDLRIAPVMVPRLLVVVTIPENIDDWVKLTKDGLLLRKWAYWKSLLHAPDLTNKKTVTVEIRKSQRLTIKSLQGLMTRAGAMEPL